MIDSVAIQGQAISPVTMEDLVPGDQACFDPVFGYETVATKDEWGLHYINPVSLLDGKPAPLIGGEPWKCLRFQVKRDDSETVRYILRFPHEPVLRRTTA